MKTYTIDGAEFSTLEKFAEHFSSRVLNGSYRWTGNLNAFNDILRGGFGTPDEGFRLVWEKSHLSRERLGYAETVRQLEMWIKVCDPSNREAFQADIDRARAGRGPTVFDWIVEIIRDHGVGGEESEDGVVLELQ